MGVRGVLGSVRVGELAADLGVSTSWIRKLTDAGVLESETVTLGGHRRYDLEASRAAYARYRRGLAGIDDTGDAAGDAAVFGMGKPVYEADLALAGLEEHQVWREVAPRLRVQGGSTAHRAGSYAFTEMLNNAIDHSGGARVSVKGWRTGNLVAIEIWDDGIGVFERLARGLELGSHHDALAELTKGKRTTAPEAHTGEGIFFTSKVVDRFNLDANGLAWKVDNLRGDHAVGTSTLRQGTRVQFAFDSETVVDPAEVFRRYTVDHEFVRTSPVVRLFEAGVEFVSRSEAKKLLSGMEQFREVSVDFTSVESVGQGFVDEVFRVWPAQNPGIKVAPINMNPEVEFMVRRGLPPLDPRPPRSGT